MKASAKEAGTNSTVNNALTGLIEKTNLNNITKAMTQESKNHLSKAEREAYALVGRVGGKATFRKKGKKHMSLIGQKGAKARWQKKARNKKDQTN